MRLVALMLLLLGVAGCRSLAQTADQVPPPADPDEMAPSPVVSAPAPPNRAGMAERRVLLTVTFPLDSYHIGPDSQPVLDNLAAALRDARMRGALAEVNGHTDTSGQFGYNMALSFLRAQAVMRYLSGHGVPAGMLRAQGFGPLQLLDTANPKNTANRRVEVITIRN